MSFSSIPEAVKQIRSGGVVIVMDDEDRENEGDYICAAEKATTETINLLMSGRGDFCMPVLPETAERLNLRPLVENNTANLQTAFLTPIAKAFGTDVGMDVANQGVQVHGGMGFVEETGAAQFSRDVRVTAIYEGTNGIQAMDLVARKMMDGGDAANRLLDEIQSTTEAARATHPEMAEAVWQASETLRETTDWLVDQDDLQQRFAGAVPYLRAFARVLGGYAHLRAAMADAGGAREKLARFYIQRLLPEHAGLLAQAQVGADDLYALSVDELAA